MQDFFDAIKDLAGGEVYALVAAENTQYVESQPKLSQFRSFTR